MRRSHLVSLGLATLLGLGCATPETVSRRSSLTEYLAGAKTTATLPPVEGPARLQLPLRMGIAFVPGTSGARMGATLAGPGVGPLAPDQEERLNERVAGIFREKPWTQSFKVIPSRYLTQKGGFQDLQQVATTFGVDVIALLSVDQIQFSNPEWYSWTYWTLVGAYMVKGDKNDTTTLVDAAVYHVPSRTFLFRAGGVGQVKGSSTWSGREDAFRHQAQQSLDLAMADLSKNLDAGVAGFKQDIVKGLRKDILLVDKDGNPVGTAGYDPTRQ